MTKGPSFADDLLEVKSSVDDDVTDILQAAKNRQDQKLRAVVSLPPQALETGAPKVPVDGVPTARPKTPSRSSRQVLQEDAVPVLQNVTTRLRRETNELLTEAALRQKLKKETPDTRQDIIEVALTEWFKRHSYGRSKKSEDEAPKDLTE